MPTIHHVSILGDDAHAGTTAQPLRTIQAAAVRAQPGDTIRVSAGIYRERVDPPRGGLSDEKRITYEAAPGEAVVICGSEPVRGWIRVEGDRWQARLPNTFFGGFNPFAIKLGGHWFDAKKRDHHLGAVYLDGHWLLEAATREELSTPPPADADPMWFAEVDTEETIVEAQFPGINPNTRDVEVNVRQTVFYASKPGINYITVRGFTLRNAATPWAPPTTEQIGLIGVNWARGWVIEDNDVSYSLCSGISLGKYHDPEDKGELVEWTPDGDTFHGTIRRALLNGWDRSQVGGHRVRGNHVSHCEMAGIVGSFGAAFSEVSGNSIHHIHVRRSFGGYEMAGIKFHGAIDTLIAGNHIHHCDTGLWLDWMSQGTRASGNLIHDNSYVDLYTEVNHGPFVIDHNILLSKKSLEDVSEGGLYAHNLFGGVLFHHSDLKRTTPYHLEHSTQVVERLCIVGGEDRFFNNVFIAPADLKCYTDPALVPSVMEDNVFFDESVQARAWVEDVDRSGATVRLHLPVTPSPATRIVDGKRAGRAKITGLGYHDTDGGPLRLSHDCLSKPHHLERPHPGPFAERMEMVRFGPRQHSE